MPLPFYNLSYIKVKRLISGLLYNHVQQHILNAYFPDSSCGLSTTYTITINGDSNSNSISFFQYYLLNCLFLVGYPYMVILQWIYVALFWSEKLKKNSK